MESQPSSFVKYVSARGDKCYRRKKLETSPFNNPVSACGADDAGVEKTAYGFDPTGVAQQ